MTAGDKIVYGLFLAGAVFCIYLTLKYLWPLILVIALFAAAGIWRTRHLMKQAEEEARKSLGEQTEDGWQQDLYHSQQARHASSPDIIDAEYEEHGSEEQQSAEKK